MTGGMAHIKPTIFIAMPEWNVSGCRTAKSLFFFARKKKFIGKKYSERKISEDGQCRFIEQTSSTVAVELASDHFFL